MWGQGGHIDEYRYMEKFVKIRNLLLIAFSSISRFVNLIKSDKSLELCEWEAIYDD